MTPNDDKKDWASLIMRLRICYHGIEHNLKQIWECLIICIFRFSTQSAVNFIYYLRPIR